MVNSRQETAEWNVIETAIPQSMRHWLIRNFDSDVVTIGSTSGSMWISEPWKEI